jgi:hypothetical protein
MEMMLWNIILSGIVAVMGFALKAKFEELDRLGILLNRTREEIAREHITRAEVERDLEKLMDRFDAGIARLELKIDELRKQKSA